MRPPILLLLSLISLTLAYIPASPTNSTLEAIAGGLNVTDISKLLLQWYPNASYIENVSYELVGYETQGTSRGALIHFSEEHVNDSTPPSAAPWIAMVSCDANATDASMEVDIFTLARDKGAVAALLYSLYSVACVINPEYTDPATFDQVFDIFSTQSQSSAHIIDYQFKELSENTSLVDYDSQLLNASADAIRQSIERGYATEPRLLYAILRAYNATEDFTPAGNSRNDNRNGAGSNNTAIAMIILYAITGCVSGLFCIVIVSGAIRAMRHPERYGPRARTGSDGLPQGRARGLTRAILDTFPVVKFGSNTNTEHGTAMDVVTNKDFEAQDLAHWELVDQNAANRQSAYIIKNGESAVATMTENKTGLGTRKLPLEDTMAVTPSTLQSTRRHDLGEGPSTPSTHSPPQNSQDIQPIRDNLSPEAMGRETCPICIVDFTEGDDLRVLPCEGKHRFHPHCVDPWLLELSSSCPICRHDFLALETMLSNDSQDAEEFGIDGLYAEHQFRSGTRRSTMNNRFSRYLRFASGRHRRQQEEQSRTEDGSMHSEEDTRPHFQRDPSSQFGPQVPRMTEPELTTMTYYHVV